MPGPSNGKKKRKTPQTKRKNFKNSAHQKPKLDDICGPCDVQDSGAPSPNSPNQPWTPPPVLSCLTPHEYWDHNDVDSLRIFDDKDYNYDDEPPSGEYDFFLPPNPYIYDPGNGPRVRDTKAFLASSYFAQKPALHIPLCAEFAQPEILQMLLTVLPEETALILWYNKSRATSRICPACQRLYHLGDNLPDLTVEGSDEPAPLKHDTSPCLRREQEISGLCSPLCFVLASFNYPGAIRQAWGCMVDEIDDETWEVLNSHGVGNTTGKVGAALSMVVKMTRLHDLGLSQLCFNHDLVDGVSEDDLDLPMEGLSIVA
ncbi:hypothetical protein AMATHDRAFT_152048 [Amanita thiersii Skay4041]|uniref:Uncharacterized protein n=1 Tax=Amanita thiersii Skay4041 TaxID=703135 RepID=A0A2A9N9Z9_9AGAR|nr:hypothetical protein AMATHDRAFT_152048 [Amanita thiersii Skay4041]